MTSKISDPIVGYDNRTHRRLLIGARWVKTFGSEKNYFYASRNNFTYALSCVLNSLRVDGNDVVLSMRKAAIQQQADKRPVRCTNTADRFTRSTRP